MAQIARLVTRQARIRQDQAAALRQALLPFGEGELAPHIRELIAVIDRNTAAQNGWTFVMLSPSQNAAVVRWLRANSSRPLVALELWALCFEHLDIRTGEILLSRDQLAEAIGDRPDNVTIIMSELSKLGAISRMRERVPGLRGPGRAKYFMNPKVGTHLAGRARDQAQAKAPQLRLV